MSASQEGAVLVAEPLGVEVLGGDAAEDAGGIADDGDEADSARE